MTKIIDIENFKRQAKRRYVLHLVFLIFFIMLYLAGMLLSLLLSPFSYGMNLLINILVSVVFILLLIFYFLNIFPNVRHYHAYYKNMNNVSLEEEKNRIYLGEKGIKKMAELSYVSEEFSYREGEETYQETFYRFKGGNPFQVGKRYRLSLYHGVIVAYQEEEQ